MNTALVSLLNEAVESKWTMTPQLALAICNAATQLPTLIQPAAINRIYPESHDDCDFLVEKIEHIVDEIKPLHLAHWQETEAHRHDLPFNPDYDTFIRYEQAGRYILFTLRMRGYLMGNCAMYLDRSTHTQTLYLLPEARKGRRAMAFIRYCEDALYQLGVKEINVSVKTVNKAERFFRIAGYRHVENGLSKILEEENVRT